LAAAAVIDVVGGSADVRAAIEALGSIGAEPARCAGVGGHAALAVHARLLPYARPEVEELAPDALEHVVVVGPDLIGTVLPSGREPHDI